MNTYILSKLQTRANVSAGYSSPLCPSLNTTAVPTPTGSVWLAARGVSHRDSSSSRTDVDVFITAVTAAQGPFSTQTFLSSCRCDFHSGAVCQIRG